MNLRSKSGFTIPELLIALLIVGLLGALAIYAINVQRATTRDAKRISDVSVMRAALSQYWLQQATYPLSEGVYLGQPGQNAERLAGDGLGSLDDVTQPIYLDAFPTGPNSNEYYGYRATENGYSLLFKTERVTAYGPAGIYYAHSTGVDRLDETK
ncbi:MAG: type II secretion system protein [Patescibacteria group bacterium]|jgi:prepilin-type N-terminal cleavage/methylation domain-containing protein